jgi:integrase/recombinase XerC
MTSQPPTQLPTPPPDPFLQRVAQYLEHVRFEKRLADRTAVLYQEHLLRLHRLCTDAGLGVADVREAHIRRWVAQLHGSGLKPSGLALILSGWRGFFAWLGRSSAVPVNPVLGVRAPKAGKPLPKALAVEEALQLATHHQPDADSVLEARDRCMVELLYGSGLRLAELVGLDVQAGAAARGWVDAEAGEVHVLGKGSKWRAVPVGGPALQALQDWLACRQSIAKAGPALFIGRSGERLTPKTLRLRLRQRSVQAGLAAPVHPHMLRHTFASHVLQSSQDLRGVQELLGHANITTTQVYTRLDFQHLAKAYEGAHPRAGRAQARSAPPGPGESPEPTPELPTPELPTPELPTSRPATR